MSQSLSEVRAAVQRDSWSKHPKYRRRRLALGQMRGAAAAEPDDLTLVTEALAAIAAGQAEGRARREPVTS